MGYHSPANRRALAGLVPFPLATKKGKCSAAKAVPEADTRIIRLHSRHSPVESASNALEGHGLNAVAITASPASSATRPRRSGARPPAPRRHPARGVAEARAPSGSEWSFLSQKLFTEPHNPNPVASIAKRRAPRPFPHLWNRGCVVEDCARFTAYHLS
jgi:hypothetical protein